MKPRIKRKHEKNGDLLQRNAKTIRINTKCERGSREKNAQLSSQLSKKQNEVKSLRN